MRRIGFIGTENSHTDHFIRFLNAEERHPGFRAAALVGGRHERNETLAATGGIDVVVEAPEDLLGLVDAAIISSRDGATHRAQAEPLLAAGVPVLVDKPLATTVLDAEAIIAAADVGGAPLVSCSALRFVPEMAELTARDDDRGELRHLGVVGPADPDSEYSGLFFYGIHHVETALEILGNPVVMPGQLQPVVTRTGDTTVASTRIAGVDVTLTFITPGEATRVPFHATASFTNAVLARELTLGPDYNAPALARFVGAVESGRTPAGPEHLLSPVAVLAAIADSLEEDQS
ncbi:Gfo/Idh/MocA family oxidoreductase [Georgenia subflava]|uniref:Gfo/Idh/MocA family oxidoreductase n=1 Tax=Georgenia subflava TaxID=1622177 RepID=UPI00186B0D24|nr:Gfo/Idh/MocA family oxidoreductase [Georgenia subflava]